MLFFAEITQAVPEYTHFIPLMIAFLTGVFGPIMLVLVKHGLFRRNKDLEKRKKDFQHALEKLAWRSFRVDSVVEYESNF